MADTILSQFQATHNTKRMHLNAQQAGLVPAVKPLPSSKIKKRPLPATDDEGGDSA